ncbi:MAG: UDP-glucose/GDP-mannose dehydrogenase family protein [Verrucomicrobiae bacterium]|nr:UDP-glucose/GDP-mannose dehydrogenase family protein [Verrucomicrobiae bacterium]
MKVTLVGSGYVGLVTGTCFAEKGHEVVCVDNDEKKVQVLKAGGIFLYEPGLEEMVKRNVKAGRLRFTSSTAEGVDHGEVVFIAVPTPQQDDGSVDLSYIEAVARSIADSLKRHTIIVDKSTVPVKTGEKVAETIRRYNKHKADFDVVSNPEFLREGSAIDDLMNPDRIVIGVMSQRPIPKMRELYAPFACHHFIVTDINSAELIKHASNSFLALKISYANALAAICEASGANVEEVANGMGFDKRIGRQFLNAGLGYGGSCFPKDIAAFIKIAEELGCGFPLLKEVQRINNETLERFVKKIRDGLWVLKDKTIGVLGLAFKPNTDDIRRAPAIDLINRLQAEGARIRAYDPQAMGKAKADLKNVAFGKDAYDAAHGCDALVIATEWDEFRKLDLGRLKSEMAHPIVFDSRNIYDPNLMTSFGFLYKSIGR